MFLRNNYKVKNSYSIERHKMDMRMTRDHSRSRIDVNFVASGTKALRTDTKK